MKQLKWRHPSFWLLFLWAGLLAGLPDIARGEEAVRYEEVMLKVDGIACVTCRWAIEGRLKEIPGV